MLCKRVFFTLILVTSIAFGDPIRGIPPPADSFTPEVAPLLYRKMVQQTFDPGYLEQLDGTEEAPLIPTYLAPQDRREADAFARDLLRELRQIAFVPEWPTLIHLIASRQNTAQVLPFLREIKNFLDVYPTPLLLYRNALKQHKSSLDTLINELERVGYVPEETLRDFEKLIQYTPVWECLEKVSRARFKTTGGAVFHVIGSRYTSSEIHWMMEFLGAYGVPVELTRWDRNFIDMRDKIGKKANKELRIERQREATDLAAVFEQASEEIPDLKPYASVEAVLEWREGIVARAERFFGMPRGFWVTLSPYYDRETGLRRPNMEKVWDVALAITLASIVSVMTYEQSIAKLGDIPEARKVTGAVVNFGWRFVFGFFKKSSTAFHKGGVDYRHDLGRVESHIVWTYFSMFVFGMFQSVSYQAATGQYDLASAFGSSLFNVTAKQVPTNLLFAMENRANTIESSRWKALAKGFTSFLGCAVQVGVEYLRYSMTMGWHKSPVESGILVGLAVLGFSHMVLQHFLSKAPSWSDITVEGGTKIGRTFRRFVGWIRGNHAEACKRYGKDRQLIIDTLEKRVEPMVHLEIRLPKPEAVNKEPRHSLPSCKETRASLAA